MKVTIEVADELYRRVKAKSALEGRPVREVAEELFHAFVETGGEPPPPEEGEERPLIDGEPAPPWFGILRRYAHEVEHHDMDSIDR